MIQPNPDHWAANSTPTADLTPSSGDRVRRASGQPTSEERAELAGLVGRAQAGEASAQSELVRRYTHRIAGHVRLIIHQPDAVEDVVQMVFIKMFRRLGRLRDPVSFEAWLFRLSRNTALDFIRRRRCRPVTVTAESELFELSDPTNAGAAREIMDALTVALEQVSPKDRDLVMLFVEGNSYRSLAERHGLTLGAVKARLHRLRPFLRSFVGEATETRLARAVA